MSQDSAFWDRIAARYARRPVADQESYEKKLWVTRDYFRPDMTVLEFGCGTGSTAIAQAPYVRHIRAIDISENMLAIARDRAARAGVANVSFERAALADLDAADGSFDAIMGHSILHVVPDRDAVIAKVHRLLKRRGVFITSTTCLGDTMSWFRFIVPIGRMLRLFPLVKVFKVRDLVDSLTRAGFAIEHRWQPAPDKAVFIVARKTG